MRVLYAILAVWATLSLTLMAMVLLAMYGQRNMAEEEAEEEDAGDSDAPVVFLDPIPTSGHEARLHILAVRHDVLMTDTHAVADIQKALHDVSDPDCRVEGCRGGVVHNQMAQSIVHVWRETPGTLYEAMTGMIVADVADGN